MSQLGQIVYVDIAKIHPNNYNPNVMNEEKFNALVDFCRTHGAEKLDPIWLRNDGIGKYEIIDGEHRWKAVKAVGWKRLRAFIVDMEAEDSKAFNVRKNRERGQIDVFKLGRIFHTERQKGAKVEDIAQKYGYATKNGSSSKISEIEQCAEYEEEIRQKLNVPKGTRISMFKAIKTLYELKREERGEPTEETPKETKQIVDEMVNEVAPALEKAFENVKPFDKQNPERNKLVLNMLLKNLVEGLLYCPVCKQRMFECSHCHTSLSKMKETKQL